jgi:hypothetical protein
LKTVIAGDEKEAGLGDKRNPRATPQNGAVSLANGSLRCRGFGTPKKAALKKKTGLTPDSIPPSD